jgi:class 3 adenylate cyclase/tetratricopeptide (TPR) repeat protein
VRIFLSYRRSDAPGHAGRLFDALAGRFGAEHVFMDVDAIEPGVDFTNAVRDAISSCDVFLALIGTQWLSSEDGAGRLRVFLDDDYLRVEVEQALQRSIPVVPVLVQGSAMPRPDELPMPIADLGHRNSVALSDPRWRQDVEALCIWIEQQDVADVGTTTDTRESGPGSEPHGEVDRPEERKVVTVLVANLVASTIASALDVEDLQYALAPHQASVRQILESFGGTVEQFIGDTVMAVFGAPTVHEDDAERAIRASLAIRDAELGDDLHVAIGISTGEALFSPGAEVHSDKTGAGAVINAAALLQLAAPLDGVLVGEATHQATDRQIMFQAASTVEARGIKVPCWLAIEPRSLVPIPARDSFPLVGRERERRRLIDVFEECRAERTVQLVTIVGVPGIGKSRLVDELGMYIENDTELTTWRHGHVLPYGTGVAFFALTEIVKQECGILDSDDLHAAATKLDAAIVALGLEDADATWIRNQVGPLVGIETVVDGSGQSEAFAGWRLLFETMASGSPTVLVIDDLHWADDALLNFVDQLVDRIRDVPLLVVATARPELLERRPSWGGGRLNTHTVGLAPLSAEDLLALIGSITDKALLPAETEALVLERSGGNPLYAQEYVRAIVERGTTTALPDTVQGIIAGRLDGLSVDEKNMLQDAAVIGPIAWLGALCALGKRDRSDADEMLLRLERRQFVYRARRSSIAGEVELAFAHALVREVAYGQLPRRVRAERHVQVAHWLEQAATDRADTAETIAHHYTTALELYTALGNEIETLRSRALTALTAAAHQAAARHDHKAIIHYTDTALTLTPDPARRAELLVLRAVASFTAGDPDEALLLEARDTALDHGHREDAVFLTHLLTLWAEGYAADGRKTAEYAATGLRLAADLPPGPIAVLPATHAVFRLLISGRVDEAIKFADVEIALAREADSDIAVALLLIWRGSALVDAGDTAGVEDMRESLRVLDDQAHPQSAAAAYNLGIMLQGLGRLHEASAAFQHAVSSAHRSGTVEWEYGGALALAVVAFHQGEPLVAQNLLESVATASELSAAEAASVGGRLILERHPHKAADAAARHLQFGRGMANLEIQCDALALAAHAAQAAGDTAVAGTLLSEYLKAWSQIGGSIACSPSLVEAGLVLVAHNRHDELKAATLLLPIAASWREAALALADRRFVDAAMILDSIPSIPLRDATLRFAHGEASVRSD